MSNRIVTIISIVMCLLMMALAIILLVTGSEGAFGIERTILNDIFITLCFLNGAVMFSGIIIRRK